MRKIGRSLSKTACYVEQQSRIACLCCVLCIGYRDPHKFGEHQTDMLEHFPLCSCRELEEILSDRHEDITNLHNQLATSRSR